MDATALKTEDHQESTGHHQVDEEVSIAAVLLRTTTDLLHLHRHVINRTGATAETITGVQPMMVHDTTYLHHQVKAGILSLDHLDTDLETIVQIGVTVEPLLSTHMCQPTMPEDLHLEMTDDHEIQMTAREKVGVVLETLVNPEINMKTIVPIEADRTGKEMRGTSRRVDEMGGPDHGAPIGETGTETAIGMMSIGDSGVV